jgi:hypothetical protein
MQAKIRRRPSLLKAAATTASASMQSGGAGIAARVGARAPHENVSGAHARAKFKPRFFRVKFAAARAVHARCI